MTTMKLSEEEIKTLTDLRTRFNNTVYSIGQVKLEQIASQQELDRLNLYETDLISEYNKFRTEESAFADQLTKKYGPGEINLETNEYLS